MKHILFLAFAMAFAYSSSAQTKMIAHRSHSGSDATFSLRGLDNFGYVPPMKEIKPIEPTKDTAKAEIKPAPEKAKPTTKKERKAARKAQKMEKKNTEKKATPKKTTAKKESSVDSGDSVVIEEKRGEPVKKDGVVIRRTTEKAGDDSFGLGLLSFLLLPGIFVFAGTFRNR